jgi:hypothetical protein
LSYVQENHTPEGGKRMQKLFRSLIAVGGLAGLVACGDDVTVGGPAFAISGAPVTAVSVGAKVQLTANKPATWTTSAASVATVDATGLVTAVGQGTASITATATSGGEQASVTITVAAAVRGVTVSPSNAVIKPGETVGLVANVDADAGVARTVTWTSSNTAVATVSTTGVVTGVTPGVATITAASTAATSVTGSAAVTVRQPLPATISIQNITLTGTAGQTANNNNIVGSIDVNMNVDPGEQVVQRVEVLIDGTVACTQNLSGAQSEALRIAAAFEGVEDVVVSCQVNTAAFSATTGVASFFNGPHTISARAIIAGGSDVATPSTPLIFNNQSGVTAVVTNTNAPDPNAAIDPRTGLQWIGGSITINFVGVSYVSGTTISGVACTVFGKSAPATLTNGTGSIAYAEGTTYSTTNAGIGNYLTPPASATTGESITCGSATLSNGSSLTTTSGSVLLNYGSPLNPTIGGNAAMPVLQLVRVDNTAPGATSANGVAQKVIDFSAGTGVVDTVRAPWVNSTTSLLPAATGSSFNVLGLPSLAVLNAPVTAGADIEEGVDAITVSVWVPAAGGSLPTTGGSCNVTGLTSVTTGSQLAETTVSSAFPVRIVMRDALGNQFCYSLGAFGGATAIGADFTAPTGTITGPAANTGYNASGLVPGWAVTASDNASGFTATPLRVTMNRLNANNTTSCVINTGGSCTGGSTAAQPLTFSGTGGSTTDGYYTTSITLTDAAGNSVQLVNAQLNELDAVAPVVFRSRQSSPVRRRTPSRRLLAISSIWARSMASSPIRALV